MQKKITKRNVDATEVEARDVFVWDTEVKGFGLKVTPKGRKVYLLQYRLPGTSTRRYTIGVHGAPWTPDGARNEAITLLSQVLRGEDPAEARQAIRADPTIAQLCDLYLAEGVATKKASTVSADRARIERHLKPLLGRKQLRSLARADISRFLSDVSAGKTAVDERTRKRGRAIVRGGPVAANRALATLSAILAFANERGLRADNPVRGVKKFKEGKRARFLSNEEIARLGEALREAESRGVNSYAIAAIRLLILTGCRKNEVLALRWEEVDLSSGALRLSDSKTGAKQVLLGAPARAILAELPRQFANPYVICGRTPAEHLVGLQKVWVGVRAKAGLCDVRLHDLRHSFASVAARSGESLLIIGKVLGHSTAAATSRYAHLSNDPIRVAVEKTASEVGDMLRPARKAK
ncbi:MAG: site-specific integrase [Hyphomonas sp.]|uniref:site-specific integrase n=1 Tax=Hyphomonas sp. TaxID=87 RepID=UPI003002FDD7